MLEDSCSNYEWNTDKNLIAEQVATGVESPEGATGHERLRTTGLGFHLLVLELLAPESMEKVLYAFQSSHDKANAKLNWD